MVDFSKALAVLKSGKKIKRKSWPHDMFLEYGCHIGDTKKEVFTTFGTGIKAGLCIRYTFTQDDILAEDWYVRFKK